MRAWSWQKKGILWGLACWAFAPLVKYLLLGETESSEGLIVSLILWLSISLFIMWYMGKIHKKQ